MENNVIDIWIGVNKDKSFSMFTSIPTRGKSCWVGHNYINSIIRKNIEQLVSNSSMAWNSEPEFIQLTLKQMK